MVDVLILEDVIALVGGFGTDVKVKLNQKQNVENKIQ